MTSNRWTLRRPQRSSNRARPTLTPIVATLAALLGAGIGGVLEVPDSPAAQPAACPSSIVIVFLNPDSRPLGDPTIQAALERAPGINNLRFMSQADAYQEFVAEFGEGDGLSPHQLPASYRFTAGAVDEARIVADLTSANVLKIDIQYPSQQLFPKSDGDSTEVVRRNIYWDPIDLTRKRGPSGAPCRTNRKDTESTALPFG